MIVSTKAGLVFVVLSLGTLSAVPGAAQVPRVEPGFCSGATAAICDALRLPDAALRLEEGRRAIRAVLMSPDPEIGAAAVRLLTALAEEEDLRSFAELFSEACASRSRCFWTPERADYAELHFGPRAARLEILENSIRAGAFKQSNGTTVLRVLAIQWAALQGLDELGPLVHEFIDTLTESQRQELRLTETSMLLDLMSGAETQAEAPVVAAFRLASMSDEDFARRVEDEAQFREAVHTVGFLACRGHLLSGGPGCAWLAGVVERQARRFPDRTFQEGDIGLPDEIRFPQWLEALHGQTRGLSAGSPPEGFAPPEPGAHGPPLRAGIDPCTLPELWGSEHWGPVTFASSGVLLLDQSTSPARVVSVADGLRGHRAGETVRLRIDVVDRSGARLTDPFAMRLSLSPQSGGSLSPPGKGRSCRSMNLFWNAAAAEGTSLTSLDEFDYTLGTAVPAGRVPDPDAPRRSIPIWRATERIEIQLVKFRGMRMPAQEGGSVFDVRPEGDPQTPMPTPFEALGRRRDRPTEAEFFGPDLMEDFVLVHGPRRQYAVLVDETRADDTRTILCFSLRKDGSRVTQDEPVVLRRLEDSSAFIGSFLAMPDGYPAVGTEPGGVLGPPSVVIPLGDGQIGCEDPPATADAAQR